MSFQRSRRAQQAIVRAHEYAAKRHEELRAEHMLLGLLEDPHSVATRALSGIGAKLDDLRTEVRAAIPKSTRGTAGDKNILAQAEREARRLRHRHVGSEHLLLALLHRPDRPVASLLQKHRVTHDRVRACVIEILAAEATTQGVQGAGDGASLPAIARSNVVMCRVGDQDLEAIDVLVEASVCATRSEAAAWLIRAGITANKALFDRLGATVGEIRRLQEQVRTIVGDDAKLRRPRGRNRKIPAGRVGD